MNCPIANCEIIAGDFLIFPGVGVVREEAHPVGEGEGSM
jgi:hypothetical protein